MTEQRGGCCLNSRNAKTTLMSSQTTVGWKVKQESLTWGKLQLVCLYL